MSDQESVKGSAYGPATTILTPAEKTERVIQRLEAEVERLRAALEEIAEGAGPFNRDPLTHAANCIEAMKAVARAALRGEGEK